MLNAGKRTKTATAVAALVALGVVGGAIPIQGTDAAVTMSGMELRGSLSAFAAIPSPAISPVFHFPIKTILLVLHIAGVTLGFGAALFLDLFLVQRLYHRPVTTSSVELVKFGERIVTVGLAMLWISGIGFLLHYSFQSPQSLANPKLWAKIAIVCVLTMNGFAIHAVVAPRLQQSLGRPMLAGLALGAALPFLAVGAISAVSWTCVFLLGIVRELNYVVPGIPLLAIYLGLVGLAILAASAIHIHQSAGAGLSVGESRAR